MVQLQAFGATDQLLTGDPDITFMKKTYKRYSNFASEAIHQVFSGTADFGTRVSCLISKNGDLIERAFLQIVLPALPNEYRYVNTVGLAMLKAVELEIGGTRIDRQTSEFLFAQSELTQDEGKLRGYDKLVGTFRNWDPTDDTKCLGSTSYILHVPLEFYFMKDAGMSLPMVAIAFSDVRMHFEFRALRDLVVCTSVGANDIITLSVLETLSADIDLYIDCYFLSVEERRRYVDIPQEVLCLQTQTTTEILQNTLTNPQAMHRQFNLTFVHPVREMMWMFSPRDANPLIPINSLDRANFAFMDVCSRIKLLVNNQDRMTEMVGPYFRDYTAWLRHTRVPDVPIYTMPFCLYPEDSVQPSGTINFTKLDSVRLSMDVDLPLGTIGTLHIFAPGYNVLRIANGYCSIAFGAT